MCTGYAVINVLSEAWTFKILTYLILWDEKEEYGFYAVWSQMHHYCRYCHEEGHVVANCPKRRTRSTCWNHGADGHLATSCTRNKSSKRFRKRPETRVATQPSVEQVPVALANTESPEIKEASTKEVKVQQITENQVLAMRLFLTIRQPLFIPLLRLMPPS